MRKRAFLFDGNSFCYRAFFAIGHMSTSQGEPTNAVYGFLTMIRRIIATESPDYVAMCFDRKEATFRHKKYENYKVHRKPMPDDLVTQIPVIKEFVRAYNMPLFEKPGFEADDLLGTLACELEAQGLDVFVVTGDKDALQLVRDHIKVYSMYRDKVTIYDRAAVKKRYDSLGPEKITDIMGLMGDQSDNIPGIPGIGEKTAIQYINEFGSLEGLIAHAASLKSEKKQALIKEYADLARLSKELATIDCAVPLTYAINELKAQAPDNDRLIPLFQKYEFRSFIKDVVPQKTAKQEKRTYHSIVNKKDFDLFIKQLKTQKAYAFDTETTSASAMNAKLVGLSFCFKACEAYYIALSYEGIQTKQGVPLEYALDALKKTLEDDTVKKYGQNIKYDYLVLLRHGITLKGISFDTMIAAYLVNPNAYNQNLDAISFQYLNVTKITYESLVGKGKAQKTIDEVDITLVAEYACEDADCVYRLVPILEKEIKERELEELFYAIEMPLTIVLAYMEYYGIALDTGWLKKLSANAEKELNALTKKIYKAAGEEFNINSPKQLSTILFEKLALPVVKKTKTGYSTDVSVLETLAQEHILPKHLLEYREYAKLKSTYLDALPELVHPETGMVHTSFNQTITSTGRLSSSSPNLQNIPIKTEVGREVRKAFVARDEKRSILSADYSQIELRFLAHFSEDDTLIDAFCKGRDIHTVTATLLYEVKEKDVTPEMRHFAKTINFSIIYGKTPFGLSRDLQISIKDAKDFIDAYFARYKKIGTYLESLKQQARDYGYVTTVLGRRALFPDILSKNGTIRQFAERAATNAPLQGSASDLIKKAMIEIHNTLLSKKLDAHMVLQVHDELVFDVADAYIDRVTALVVHKMEKALSLRVPLVVDTKIGKSWFKE